MGYTRAKKAPLASMIALLVLACGGKDASAPSSQPPSSAAISRDAENYLSNVVSIMQSNSLNRLRIDWTDFRKKVFDAAKGAQSVTDTYDAIGLAIDLLGDGRSYFVTPGGAITPSRIQNCPTETPIFSQVPSDVAYIKVPSFVGGGAEADAFATGLQTSIRTSDQPALTGWIIDLRGNSGGNMWPMIAGVGPLLGEGTVGYSVKPGPGYNLWRYRNGVALVDTFAIATVRAPYRLIKENPRVAILVDNAVASAGEAIAIAFKARPDTRFFGVATCGLSTMSDSFGLSNGASLVLTIATMADRSKALYGDRVSPDELISEPMRTYQRAVEWLQTGK